MAVKVVADLHSAVEALGREVPAGDTLLLLGDLVNVIDYRSMSGILVDVYGLETMQEVVKLRSMRRYAEAKQLMAGGHEGLDPPRAVRLRERMEAAYQQVASALPRQTYVIPGNIDPPAMIDLLIRPGVDTADGKVFEIGGLAVGFLGGGLPTPAKVAGEIPEEEYDAKLEALGDVDVICSHIPPDIPELTYDVLANRHERGSSQLAVFIRRRQPKKVFFGHIHQPLVSSMHLGRTHLINAGYFRRTGRAMRLGA